MTAAKIGVLTVSDRASSGIYEDKGGTAIEEYFRKLLTTEYSIETKIVADDLEVIVSNLKSFVAKGFDLVVTTGGTGPEPRDVTPEATREIIDKELLGFGEKMRMASLAQTPTAILSRQLAGIANKTLIVNLPGSPRSINVCLDAIMEALPFCLDLIGAAYIDTDPKIIQAYRPKKS